jgi:SAM-dependent methyltransferase
VSKSFPPKPHATSLSAFQQPTFVGADPNPKAVEKARRIFARSNIANLTIIDAPRRGRLPFDAGSFDNVVLVLTLHDRVPDEKLEIAREMFRLLRHGGKLHVADYDKPVVRGERGILRFAEYISGPAAAEPHLTGGIGPTFSRRQDLSASDANPRILLA